MLRCLVRLDKPGFKLLPGIDLVALHQQLLHLVHLRLEVCDAPLQLERFLSFCVLCHGVLDLLDTGRVVKRVLHLTLVVDGGRAVDEHESLGRATERVFHQLGEHVVSVRDEFGSLGKCLDDIAQRCQTHVDCISFFLALFVDTSLGGLLRAGQIDEGQLAYIAHSCIDVSSVNDD